MLQQDEPEDYVLATGVTTAVRDFVRMAFTHAGIDIEWRGEGVGEKGFNAATGEVIVEVDPKYFRPTEVDQLIGDPSKAKTELGWKATHSVDDLVKDMMESDLKLFERDEYLKEGGHAILQQHE